MLAKIDIKNAKGIRRGCEDQLSNRFAGDFVSLGEGPEANRMCRSDGLFACGFCGDEVPGYIFVNGVAWLAIGPDVHAYRAGGRGRIFFFDVAGPTESSKPCNDFVSPVVTPDS